MTDRPGPHPVLRTTTRRGERLTLRPPVPRDAEALVATCTDPDTREWTTIPPEYDIDRARAFIANAPGWWERGQGARFILADGDDACVGLLDLRTSPDDPHSGDVFFIASPTARGRGYMSAALRAAAEWAIRERGLVRIEWRAIVGNEGSRRVAEAAGFQPEGVARLFCDQRGKRRDAWVASLTVDDLR